jgi:hypothetical protein
VARPLLGQLHEQLANVVRVLAPFARLDEGKNGPRVESSQGFTVEDKGKYMSNKNSYNLLDTTLQLVYSPNRLWGGSDWTHSQEPQKENRHYDRDAIRPVS